jgi:hypothetical protein
MNEDGDGETGTAVTYVRECGGCGALTMPGNDGRWTNCGEPIA